jgi:hypothetical protein
LSEFLEDWCRLAGDFGPAACAPFRRAIFFLCFEVIKLITFGLSLALGRAGSAEFFRYVVESKGN